MASVSQLGQQFAPQAANVLKSSIGTMLADATSVSKRGRKVKNSVPGVERRRSIRYREDDIDDLRRPGRGSV